MTNKKVTLDYSVKVKGEYQVVDTSEESVAKENNIYNEQKNYEPLSVELGKKQIIPGLEKELEDVNEGDEKTIEVDSDDAYGKKAPPQTIPKQKLKDLGAPEAKEGMKLATSNGMVMEILEVKDDKVKIDLNHPLAGKDLIFDVKIKETE